MKHLATHLSFIFVMNTVLSLYSYAEEIVPIAKNPPINSGKVVNANCVLIKRTGSSPGDFEKSVSNFYFDPILERFSQYIFVNKEVDHYLDLSLEGGIIVAKERIFGRLLTEKSATIDSDRI